MAIPGYFGLAPGERGAVIDGRAVSVTGQSGEWIGGSWYPEGSTVGYRPITRTRTQRELHAELQDTIHERREREPQQQRLAPALDVSDWK